MVHAPAKINLWLEVIRKRSDGYHDLSSLMLPIGIFDELEVAVSPEKGIGLTCDDPSLPLDGRNLAWKAADLYLREAELDSGVCLRLKKRIPVAGGLGGGSADAACVLTAMNRLFDERLDARRLHDLAAELGADVPFFIHGKPALATGIGDRLDPLEGIPPYPLVLINPPVEVSTGWVYRSLRLTRGVSRIKLRTFLDRPWELDEVMQNDLETVTLAQFPVLAAMKDWLVSHGALGALMSGSGPTVFAVFADFELASRVAASARSAWKDCWVGATRVLSGSFSHQGS